jgi:hypothetical protein
MYLFCQLSLSSLEKALHAYTLGPATQPFDIKAVPVAAVEEETRAKVSFNSLVYTLGPATQPFDIKAVPVAAVEEETRAKVSSALSSLGSYTETIDL